jgi:hypothetical protein
MNCVKSIFCLPPEVLRIIVDYVQDRNVLNLQLTCKWFRNEIAPKLWSRICIDASSLWLTQSLVAEQSESYGRMVMMPLHYQKMYIKLDIYNLQTIFKMALFGHLDEIVPHIRTVTLINGEAYLAGQKFPEIIGPDYDASILAAKPFELLFWLVDYISKNGRQVNMIEIWNWPTTVGCIPSIWAFISKFPSSAKVQLRLSYESAGIEGYFTNAPYAKGWHDKLLSTNINSITIDSGAASIWLKNNLCLPSSTERFTMTSDFCSVQTIDISRLLSRCTRLTSLRIGCRSIKFSAGLGMFWPDTVIDLGLDIAYPFGTGEAIIAPNVKSLLVSRQGVTDILHFPGLDRLYMEISPDIWHLRRFQILAMPDFGNISDQLKSIESELNIPLDTSIASQLDPPDLDPAYLRLDETWDESFSVGQDEITRLNKNPLPLHYVGNLRHLFCKESELCTMKRILQTMQACHETLESLYLVLDCLVNMSMYNVDCQFPKLEIVVVILFRKMAVFPLLRIFLTRAPKCCQVYVVSEEGLDEREAEYFLKHEKFMSPSLDMDGEAITSSGSQSFEYSFKLNVDKAKQERQLFYHVSSQ